MGKAQFQAQLRVGLARIAEHEPDTFALAITVGSIDQTGNFQFCLGLISSPEKVSQAASPEAAVAFMWEFRQVHGHLPTCVIVCHVTDATREQIVSQIVDIMEQAVVQPRPKDAGDVEHWQFWLRKAPDAPSSTRPEA